jgi:hypothetical protein
MPTPATNPASPSAAPKPSMVSPAPVYPLNADAVPVAIVVHCSDPRFQEAFAQFIAEELHLVHGQYIPIVLGGGAGVLARPDQLPKDYKFLKDRLQLHHVPTVNRLILINHEDCRYYDSILGKLTGFLGARSKDLADPRRDLSLVAKITELAMPHLGLTPEMYYARFADASHKGVVFEKIG